MISFRDNDKIMLPGLASVHSHAFQRGLRGRTHQASAGRSSFWSWRSMMYTFAQHLNPESIYAMSRLAYAELALAGVCAVGEFHYVHHQHDGKPYDSRTEMADAVIQAAIDVGIRITLLRVVYQTGGIGKPAEDEQRRFVDHNLDDVFGDIQDLRSRYSDEPLVTVGIAPHSIRALSREGIKNVSDFAFKENLPLHMHVSEQRRELEECQTHYGETPIKVLSDDGVLGPHFVGVHATHATTDEIDLLAKAKAFVCLCRTTERDLGDGLCPSSEFFSKGVKVCLGVDSHAISDPFEEMRAVELDDRSRLESRHAACAGTELLHAASTQGYQSLRLKAKASDDQVVLDATDPALCGLDESVLDDGVVFAAPTRSIQRVSVAGKNIVSDGALNDWSAIRTNYERTLKAMLA